MVKKSCMVCGGKFSVKEYDVDRRKYCDDVRCDRERRRQAMQRYRQTDRGRAMVKVQNMRYKREEVEYECYVCKGKFMSTRKRNTCDKCIERLGSDGVSKPNFAVNMRIWRAGNMDKVRAYTKSEIRSDGLSRRKRLPCLVCSNPKTEQHHHNYQKPLDVTFLCKKHHHELHTWDAV